MVWDTAENIANRYGWYPGNGYVPWTVFGGTLSDNWSNYNSMQNAYNQIVDDNSPLEVDLTMEYSGEQLQLTANITATDDIPANITSPKVFFVITQLIEDNEADYVNKVLDYKGNYALEISSSGETEEHTANINFDESWDLAEIKGVCVVQSWTGTKDILQAAQTGFEGLMPLMYANVQSGPACLGVQFTDNSLPHNGIETWEWDFDGDGTFDSTEQHPYHLYEEPGTYDVVLRIFDGLEYEEKTYEDFITVLENGETFSGNISGIWKPDFNPYQINNDVEILSADSLIIEPGTEIYLENALFTVYGKLTADGTGEFPIIFTSNEEWSGIKLKDSEYNNSISNCEISHANICGIKVDNANVDILNNKIFENSSGASGAGIDVNNSNNVHIENNLICNNMSSSLAGGIGCNGSSIEIWNNIIVNNQGLNAGSISLKNNSDANIVNNTITHNSANSEFFLFNSFPNFMNCIIMPEHELFTMINSAPFITYSCIDGGYSGVGNIDEDPLFENTSEGFGIDYNGQDGTWYLQTESPCIDAGNPDAEYNDIEDVNNPGYALFPAMGTITNDMGAFGGLGFQNYTDSHNDIIPAESAIALKVFPNPFNPQTTISFKVKNAESAQIVIYNIRGQKIISFENLTPYKQKQKVIWNGTDKFGKRVSSGVYLISLKSATEFKTQKVLLLK